MFATLLLWRRGHRPDRSRTRHQYRQRTAHQATDLVPNGAYPVRHATSPNTMTHTADSRELPAVSKRKLGRTVLILGQKDSQLAPYPVDLRPHLAGLRPLRR